MVLRPEKEAEARAVFDKWDLDFAVVGETIAEDRFIVRARRRGEGRPAAQGAVGRRRRSTTGPGCAPPAPAPLGPVPEVDPAEALLRADREPEPLRAGLGLVAVRPAGDGRHGRCRRGRTPGVVRVHGTGKAIAFTSDVTPRYCRANPERGGMQAVAEAYRNLTRHRRAAAGGDRQPQLRQPGAAGDHGPVRRLHPGHRARPARRSTCRSCRATSASTTRPTGRAILPTPTIGGGRAARPSLERLIRMAPRDGDVLLLLGETRGHLGQSALLAEVFGREEGDAPPVDLARRAGGGRVRARGQRGGAGRARRTTSPTAGSRWRRRRWRWRAGVGVEIVADAELDAAGLVLRRGPGALPRSPAPGGDVDRLLARARRGAACRSGSSGDGAAADAIRLGESRGRAGGAGCERMAAALERLLD